MKLPTHGIVFLILVFLAFEPQRNTGSEISTLLDVFDLPSAQHSIIAEGRGYFPVLQAIDKQLFAVFRAGGGYLGRGGYLASQWSTEDGRFIDPPQVVVNSPEDDRNPAVGVSTNGRIIVAYLEQGSYNADGSYESKTPYMRAKCKVTGSDDRGKTWSPPKPLGVPGLESVSPYGKIIRYGSDTLLLNVYGPYTDKLPGTQKIRRDLPYISYLIRSSDNGETWGEPSLMAAGYNETALLALPNGNLLAAFRSMGNQRVDISESTDQGHTWSSPRRITGSRQHPGDLLLLSNGWILLLYSDRSGRQETIRGVISQDQGESWDIAYTWIFSRPVNGDFGYPSAALLPNGFLAILYYWAGEADNAYDGSKTQCRLTLVRESELIEAYKDILSSNEVGQNPSSPQSEVK